MAQGDYLIQNQSFPSFRSDLNSTLEAINTSNSGTSRPSSAVAGTIWLDTTNATNPTLKLFDGTDDISLATFDYSSNTVNWLDSTVSADLVNDLSPQLGGMLDVNGNAIGNGTEELIKFSETASAVNEVTVTNSATGNAPEISATGDDTNIDFKLTPKGTGKLVLDGLNFPTADGTADQVLKTDGSGNLSFTDVSGGTNTPAFLVKSPEGSQSLSDGVWTKITAWDNVYDTASGFDFTNDKYTIPSGEGGKYFVYSYIKYAGSGSRRIQIAIYKNGSLVQAQSNNVDYYAGVYIAVALEFAASDYIEIYCKIDNGGGGIVMTENSERFGAYKIIE